MQTYTLFQLNEYIRRILALNFSEPLWITAEIAQVGTSRGHYFLSLVQKEEEGEDIIAQSEAVLWDKTFRRMRRQLGVTVQELLQKGRSVKIRVQVDFHERYGLKLIVHELDPAYTLGQLELKRRQTIEALQAAGHLKRNAQLRLPSVVQRLAVISSETAAGYQDFTRQLAQNEYGYHFSQRLFPSAMQGQQVAIELPAQISKINRQAWRFDAVVVIRGGGARLDLSAFDEQVVAASLATCQLPVLTGIGHETDETVADLVAHTQLKTPTAVADWLVSRALQFESDLLQLARQLEWITRKQIQQEQLLLTGLRQQVRNLGEATIRNQQQLLQFITAELPARSRARLRSENQQIGQLEQMLNLLSIDNTLQRGFTLTQLNDHPLRSVKELKTGDRITTLFQDGKIDSDVH